MTNVNDVKNANYETRDANVPAVLGFTIALVITIVLTLVFSGLFVQDSARESMALPLVSAEAPQPRLETDPQADLRNKRAAEDKILHSYAWIDRQNGVVRIPIERAMNLVVERDGGSTR